MAFKTTCRRVYVLSAVVVLILSTSEFWPKSTFAQPASQTFPETGKTVSGKFLDYWKSHGGLAQQGFPISEELEANSDTDGKTYTAQYFERAVFEVHPENQPPNDVLLQLLGVFRYKQKYPGANGALGQQPDVSAGSVSFSQTSKHLGGMFLDYWQTHGGLAQQGYPISEPFTEKSDLDGKSYTVQYFERAVFEAHPENKPPFNVLLSQLGTFRYRDAHEVQIVLSFKHIAPMDLTIPAGRTRFIVTNTDTQFGQTDHNFSIYKDDAAVAAGTPLAATPIFRPSEGPKVVEIDLRPGNYLTRCDVPGHAEAGMVGTITVTAIP